MAAISVSEEEANPGVLEKMSTAKPNKKLQTNTDHLG